MARASIMFIVPFMKATLLGDEANPRRNSSVKKLMQRASRNAILGLSTGSPLASSTSIQGKVLKHMQQRETSTTDTENSDITLAGRLDCGFCSRSHSAR